MASLFGVVLAGGAAAAEVGIAQERGAVAASGALDEFTGLVELPSGREVYLECRGEGSPMVMLESGGGLAASQWSVLAPGSPLTAVFPAVSQFTRVCAYDRPGTVQVPDGAASRSDPVPLPRTFADMVIELRELLEAADVPGPYVLAGHSMGGAVARLFAGQYPDDVAGFVSLDAANATIYESFVELVGPGCCDLPGVEFRVQEAIVELRAARPLPRIPMVVLEHSRDRQQFPNPIGWPADWPIPELLDIWDRAQEEIAALVPGAVFDVAEHSEHNIMIDQPVLVTDSIRAVVDAVRRGEDRISTGGLATTGPVLWPLVASAALLVAFGVAFVVLSSETTARRRSRSDAAGERPHRAR
jgi:pimeloyl-ACP methyl ester carboxylesterase